MQLKVLMVTALSAIMLCLSPGMPATMAAEPYSIVSPLYEIGSKIQLDLYVNGSTASCISMAKDSNAVTITAKQYLQKQGILWIWSTYDDAEWTETVEASYITMSNTKSDLDSGKYRLKTVFTLTDANGKTETIKVYSDEVTVD